MSLLMQIQYIVCFHKQYIAIINRHNILLKGMHRQDIDPALIKTKSVLLLNSSILPHVFFLRTVVAELDHMPDRDHYKQITHADFQRVVPF